MKYLATLTLIIEPAYSEEDARQAMIRFMRGGHAAESRILAKVEHDPYKPLHGDS